MDLSCTETETGIQTGTKTRTKKGEFECCKIPKYSNGDVMETREGNCWNTNNSNENAAQSSISVGSPSSSSSSSSSLSTGSTAVISPSAEDEDHDHLLGEIVELPSLEDESGFDSGESRIREFVFIDGPWLMCDYDPDPFMWSGSGSNISHLQGYFEEQSGMSHTHTCFDALLWHH